MVMCGVAFLKFICATLILAAIKGGAWEIKKATGGSYSPPRLAISLRDHNAGFSSSSYCVTTFDDTIEEPFPNGFTQDLCRECPTCSWKRREGFGTEQEWHAAVTAEMGRLEGGGGKPQQIGSWIAEAPATMKLDVGMLDDLSSSLEMFMGNLVVADAGTRRFFVVSGTPRAITKMLSSGFSSVTPIPPRLKIDPVVEEAAIFEEAGFVLPSHLNYSYPVDNDPEDEAWHGLHVELSPPPPAPSQTPLFSVPPANSSSISMLGGDLHEFSTTATEWVGVVASRHSSPNTDVVMEGDHAVTVEGLSSRARAYAAALEIARHGGVHWVTPHVEPKSADRNAGKVIQQWPPPERKYQHLPDWEKEEPPLHRMGLQGQDAVVGVCEMNAMDYNSCYLNDDKVKVEFLTKTHKSGKYGIFESTTHRKLRQYVVGHKKGYDGGGHKDHEIDHGTMVSGCISGSLLSDSLKDAENAQSLLLGTGAAPQAKLAYFERSRFNNKQKKRGRIARVVREFKPTYKGLADFEKDVFPQAYRVGARVYSISWGNSIKSVFSHHLSSRVDAYCFKHQDFIVIAAAGNGGVEKIKGNDGEVVTNEITHSISSPASAKSAVAVGAHDNFQHDDKSTSTQRDKLGAVLDYSSRGPTSDGRIKPDVIAPGDHLTLAITREGSSCEVIKDDRSGTSYAAPTLAGVTVLVRQYFTEGFYPWKGGEKDPDNGFEPMGALLKAILVNSGRSNDEKGPKTGWDPTNSRGWGAVDVSTTLITPWSRSLLALRVFGQWSEGCADCPKLYEGQTCEYNFEIPHKSELRMKATLVWFDYHGHNSAHDKTINNLDLTVERYVPGQPKSKLYFPNGRSKADNKNTVERIVIHKQLEGTKFTVKVTGTSVPMPAQPFALVVSGPFDNSQREKDIIYHPQPGSSRDDERRGNCGIFRA